MTYEDRQANAVKLAGRYADALIEIGAAFDYHVDAWCSHCGEEPGAGCPPPGGYSICSHCGEDVEASCPNRCFGLLARRALGVA